VKFSCSEKREGAAAADAAPCSRIHLGWRPSDHSNLTIFDLHGMISLLSVAVIYRVALKAFTVNIAASSIHRLMNIKTRVTES
jgi:hypothetical protein